MSSEWTSTGARFWDVRTRMAEAVRSEFDSVVPTPNSSHCGIPGCRICYRPRRTLDQIWRDAGDKIAVFNYRRKHAI